MSDQVRRRAGEIARRAGTLPDDELDAFLRRECGQDAALRAEVESLLKSLRQEQDSPAERRFGEVEDRNASATGCVGDGPAFSRTTLDWEPLAEQRVHRVIGPYRLLERIGAGGMGEVWLAEQTEPVRRTVALKVIKPGMDTSQVVARFEAERQALALMDHPAIAKVFDAGESPQGRPYFVMEYVRGVPITEYCDRHKLTNRERLRLFIRTCEGVQHAHQKAVIHRDLKPGNVLVSEQDGEPVPKIIDFGVAKAISQKLTNKTLHTRIGTMVGTPAYMSPEQAGTGGEDVDTRTDVYSLGVMLYELMVGALPFDPNEIEDSGFEAFARRVREEDPPRPSLRLSTLGKRSAESARRRRTDVPSLRRELQGDLDWITLRALEKDRTRRYGSPQELAADIERYLNDEPVLARPPSTAYRARKFVKRHTWGVAAAFTALLALVVVGSVMAVQARRIAAARDRAEKARDDLESVAAFQARMLSAADPEAMGRLLLKELERRVAEAREVRSDSEAAVRSLRALLRGVNSTDVALRLIDEDILGRAVQTLDEAFGDRPLLDARLRGTIGSTYAELGLYERAEPLLEAALSTHRRLLGDRASETLGSMIDLALVYERQGRYADAEPIYLEVLRIARQQPGTEPEHLLAAMNGLALLRMEQGRYAEAEPTLVEAIETARRRLGDDDPTTLQIVSNLANLYRKEGRAAEAAALTLEVLNAQRRVLGDDHRDTLRTMNVLANLYRRAGREPEAEALYLEALETRRRVLGSDHPDTLESMNSLANLYLRLGRYDDAEPFYVEALATRKRVLGADHPDTLLSMNNLALLERGRGHYDEAERLLLDVIETEKRLLGEEHPSTLGAMNNLANVYRNQGRYSEAEAVFLETSGTQSRVIGAEHPDTLRTLNNLALVYRDQERYSKSEALFRKILEARRRVLGQRHPSTVATLYNLACLEAVRGDRAKAMEWLGRAVEDGYSHADHMLDDPDLESLHGPEFDRLVERARRNDGARP